MFIRFRGWWEPWEGALAAGVENRPSDFGSCSAYASGKLGVVTNIHVDTHHIYIYIYTVYYIYLFIYCIYIFYIRKHSRWCYGRDLCPNTVSGKRLGTQKSQVTARHRLSLPSTTWSKVFSSKLALRIRVPPPPHYHSESWTTSSTQNRFTPMRTLRLNAVFVSPTSVRMGGRWLRCGMEIPYCLIFFVAYPSSIFVNRDWVRYRNFARNTFSINVNLNCKSILQFKIFFKQLFL